MPETQKTDSNQDKPGDKEKRRPRAWLWFLLYGVLVLAGLSVGSWFFKYGADRAKFWVEGLLSAAVLSVVAAQAYIYRAQWRVMEEQLRAMRDSLTETQKVIAQNERAVKAAEDNVAIAQRSFHSSERPHFGIVKMELWFDVNTYPTIDIFFMNGGNTPAWNFRAVPYLTFGHIGHEGQEAWELTTSPAALSDSFVPAKDTKVIRCHALGFKVSQGRFDEVKTNETLRLFVRGDVFWKDSHGDGQSWPFWAVYYPQLKDFGNYEA